VTCACNRGFPAAPFVMSVIIRMAEQEAMDRMNDRAPLE